MDSNFQLNYKMELAGDFESQGKLLHAFQIYYSIISEFPDFVEPYFHLANLFEMMGKVKQAYVLLKQLIESQPENNEARLFYGQFLLKNSMWNDAIEVLSYILPEEEPVVPFFIGYAYFVLNEFELARLNFLSFLTVTKDDELIHEAYIYLAKIELQLKNYDNALKYAKKCDAIYSNFWELNQIYAETYYNLGMYAHAVSYIDKAIKLNPGNSSPYEIAGKIYLKLEEYQKAETYFLKYIESKENASSDVYMKLAEACLKNKNLKDAVAYFDVAIKLDPLNEQAKIGKEKAYSILNKNLVSDG